MKQFKTESKRILDLMINSIYTNNTGIELTEERFKDINILKLSQNLINNCICNGIVEQYNYMKKRVTEDE